MPAAGVVQGMEWLWVERSPQTSAKARSLAHWSNLGAALPLVVATMLFGLDVGGRSLWLPSAVLFSAVLMAQGFAFREAYHRLKDQGR